MKQFNIILADDHAVVRDGLRMLVNSHDDLKVVGEASNGQAALQLIETLQPDVAVIDVSMPILNGIEVLEHAAPFLGRTKILVLTAHEDRSYMHRLFATGAAGYLLKRSAADELIRAIRSVAQGVRYLDPSVLEELVGTGEAAASAPAETLGVLSDREYEVLRMIAQGLTNKEIAARLEISIKTVETYKSRSMQKLQLRGRADIVRFAVDRGWLREF